MTEQDKIDFVSEVKKSLIYNMDLYLRPEFDGETSEFVVEALEKQLVKKPVTHGGFEINDTRYCPCCDSQLLGAENENYCMTCGQKLHQKIQW